MTGSISWHVRRPTQVDFKQLLRQSGHIQFGKRSKQKAVLRARETMWSNLTVRAHVVIPDWVPFAVRPAGGNENVLRSSDSSWPQELQTNSPFKTTAQSLLPIPQHGKADLSYVYKVVGRHMPHLPFRKPFRPGTAPPGSGRSSRSCGPASSAHLARHHFRSDFKFRSDRDWTYHKLCSRWFWRHWRRCPQFRACDWRHRRNR